MAGALAGGASWAQGAAPGSKMKLGLVTYLWGEHWDVPTLIQNLHGERFARRRVAHHAQTHGVEPDLPPAQREETRKRFDDSPVTFVGIGSNECYDHVDPKRLERAIQATKDFIVLSKDVGGSGVK